MKLLRAYRRAIGNGREPHPRGPSSWCSILGRCIAASSPAATAIIVLALAFAQPARRREEAGR